MDSFNKTQKSENRVAALDIAANRAARNYTLAEMLRRVLWECGSWLIRLSPRICFGWRRFVLRCFGARIGKGVHIYSSSNIYFPWNLEIGDWSAIGEEALIYNLGRVRIGSRVTISQRAHVCAGTHDYTKADMPLMREAVEIGDQVWVCADAFVGPGVVVGDGAVVGARAVVVRNVDPWTVVGGNPARMIKKRILL